MELYPIVFEKDGQALTTSREVADYFGKNHRHILRDIRNVLEQLNETPEGREFGQSNFGQSYYMNEQGKKQPAYTLTRDGFTLLAMGFTGAKAMQFKVAYINAFNRMAGMISGAAHVAAEPERLHIVPGSSETAIFLQAIAHATETGAYSIVKTYARKWRGELLGAYNDTQIRIYADIAYSIYTVASENPLSRQALYKALEREGLAEPHRNKKPLVIKGSHRAGIVLHRNDRTAGITLMK